MARTPVNTVLWFIRSLVAGEKAEGQSDQFLLEQFVVHHDESAFVALLQRHGPMAMGVCRRVLRDEHLAEDAFQATFLVLAVKAGTIRKRGSVASWLYSIALRLARKLRAKACRSKLSAVPDNTADLQDSTTEPSKREQEELLDEELQRLPEKYRLPLLLCYSEGLTQEDAAVQLGWTTGKLKGMLERGQERLRFRLSRRGVTLSAAATTTWLTDATLTAAVPQALVVATAQAALNVVLGQKLNACGVSVAVATLAKGELIMVPKKMMVVLASIFLTGTVAAGIWSTGKRHDRGVVDRGAMAHEKLAEVQNSKNDREPLPESPETGQERKQDGTNRAQPKNALTGMSAKEISLMKALNSTVTVSFNGTPMKEVLRFLEDKTKGALNFIVDEQTLRAVDVGLVEALLNDRVTKEARQIKVRVLLRIILGERNMGYSIKDDALVITSFGKAEKTLMVKMYDLGELLDPKHVDRSVAELQGALRLLDPRITFVSDKVAEADVPSAQIFSRTNRLIVRHTFEMHLEIERFLGELRGIVPIADLSGVDLDVPRK